VIFRVPIAHAWKLLISTVLYHAHDTLVCYSNSRNNPEPKTAFQTGFLLRLRFFNAPKKEATNDTNCNPEISVIRGKP